MSASQLEAENAQPSEQQAENPNLTNHGAAPPSSLSLESFSLYYYLATPFRPTSPKYQHIVNIACPVSYPVSYLRTPLPRPPFLHKSEQESRKSTDGIHDFVLPVWEGRLPDDDDVRESIEQQQPRIRANTVHGTVNATDAHLEVGLNCTGNRAIAPLRKNIQEQGLKRQASDTLDKDSEGIDATGRKRTRS